LNEIEITERTATYKDGIKRTGIPTDDLEAIALDYVPRVLVGNRAKGKIAVVNVEYLRSLIQAKEEYDWLLQMPIHQRCLQEVVRVQGSRRVIEDELKRIASRLMEDTCPACRQRLIEKYGTKEEQDERLWRRVKSLRELDKPHSMFDRVARRSKVGLAALGSGKDSLKIEESTT